MNPTFASYAAAFHKSFVAYTTHRMQELGLHFGALFFVIYIGKHPGCSQAELTSALGLDWGHSQRSVTKLAEDGFLLRKKEGRVNRLELSEKGQQAFALSHQVFDDWDAETLAALNAEERQMLFSLLAKLMPEGGGFGCGKPSKVR